MSCHHVVPLMLSGPAIPKYHLYHALISNFLQVSTFGNEHKLPLQFEPLVGVVLGWLSLFCLWAKPRSYVLVGGEVCS